MNENVIALIERWMLMNVNDIFYDINDYNEMNLSMLNCLDWIMLL